MTMPDKTAPDAKAPDAKAPDAKAPATTPPAATPPDPTTPDPTAPPATAPQATAPATPTPATAGPTAPPSPQDLTGLSYERARDDLVEVVRLLESGQASLTESMELWQRGERLATHCQQLLEAARQTVAQSTGAAVDPAA
jgi:exodeoxyribonuclease VII small subunit